MTAEAEAPRIAPRIAPLGDAALTVEFGATIDAAINARVAALAAALRAAPIAGVTELVPTLRALAVHYDPRQRGFDDLARELRATIARGGNVPAAARRVTIPACYDAALAPDLQEVAALCGLSPDEAARRHADCEYRVFMLGFLPGFPYMGLLPATLRLPRFTTPRTRVPPRSLAIAGEMTAIYPLESPGGWRLIGRVPIDLFDPAADPPALLRPGDRVRFRAVGRAEYEALRADWLAGRWRLDVTEAA